MPRKTQVVNTHVYAGKEAQQTKGDRYTIYNTQRNRHICSYAGGGPIPTAILSSLAMVSVGDSALARHD